MFDHLTYSAHQTTIDFYLFPGLKTGLGRQHFHLNINLQNIMETYLNTLMVTFYEEDIGKCAHWYMTAFRLSFASIFVTKSLVLNIWIFFLNCSSLSTRGTVEWKNPKRVLFSEVQPSILLAATTIPRSNSLRTFILPIFTVPFLLTTSYDESSLISNSRLLRHFVYFEIRGVFGHSVYITY